MAMEQIKAANIHRITASTVATFTCAGTAVRNVNVFLGSDVPFGVASDCVFYLHASQGLAAQSASINAIAAARWHNGTEGSVNTEISAFTHGYANAYQFAARSTAFTQSGSALFYFPETAQTSATGNMQNVRFHPHYGAFVVAMTISNTATAAVTHSHTLFAAFMIQGR